MSNHNLRLTSEGAGYRLIRNGSYLQFNGEDRNAFLQRQSTNDLGRLAAGEAKVSVLTSPTARILDVLTIFEEQDASGKTTLGALGLPGRTGKTAAYLRSRIFFMDKVVVTERSADTFQADIFGKQAVQALHRLGLDNLPSPGHTTLFKLQGHLVRIFGLEEMVRAGYRIVGGMEALAGFQAACTAQGVWELDEQEYDSLRIAAGIPGEAGELVDDYTPLEVNLKAAIADNKGCYTGQEVIARQITYDKVTKRLVGLRMEHPVETRSEVLIENQNIGFITSACCSAQHGAIGLAVIKRPFFEPGTCVQVKSGEETVNAFVTELPF